MSSTALKFLSFRPHPYPGGLWPAPSVKECEEIAEVLKGDTSERLQIDPAKLTEKTLKILTSYRGGSMYLEGGLSIHRYSPKTCCGNGYSGWPDPGLVEEVNIGEWIAEVEFV